jgi:hypothetical protein
MRRPLLLLSLAGSALAAAVMLWFLVPPGPTAPTAPPDDAPPERTLPPATVPSVALETSPPEPPDPEQEPDDARTAGSPVAADFNAPDGNAARDVEALHTMLRQYLRHLRRRPARPIGDDSDLAYVLTGHNPMKLVVLPPNHPALSEDGRLRDRWGTPYFIHHRGKGAFEIRSAGPDRKLFTPDDEVANPVAGQTASAEAPPDDNE